MIGSKKTKVVGTKLSFLERMDKVKSMFTSAYNEAEELSRDMQTSIEDDKAFIRATEARIAETSALKESTEAYMNKLKEFL